ncbi:unnamed protein product [Peronospora belbahrii]|uniref:Uncharacterized protein n=1 Tax=Peronospora belbahrii TaxID=622444 RepID=A0AAU9KSR7_9STRA|nr:unnamed protein product [Peronospora belbahrii]
MADFEGPETYSTMAMSDQLPASLRYGHRDSDSSVVTDIEEACHVAVAPRCRGAGARREYQSRQINPAKKAHPIYDIELLEMRKVLVNFCDCFFCLEQTFCHLHRPSVFAYRHKRVRISVSLWRAGCHSLPSTPSPCNASRDRPTSLPMRCRGVLITIIQQKHQFCRPRDG